MRVSRCDRDSDLDMMTIVSEDLEGPNLSVLMRSISAPRPSIWSVFGVTLQGNKRPKRVSMPQAPIESSGVISW